MKTLTYLSMACALAVAAACGDSDDTADDDVVPVDAAVAPDTPAPDAGPPAAPVLSAQIDRAGRPAISTALIDPFNLSEDQGAKKDTYNQDANVAQWATTWAPDVAMTIAILDGLDRNCGNQILFDGTTGYGGLANVLANDVLVVNGAPTTCNGTYLAVEADATGLLANDDCGGRVPAADVVDISYSALAGVTFLPPAVGDGVSANDRALPSGFPYLAGPE